MIRNERQYKITRTTANKFESAIASLINTEAEKFNDDDFSVSIEMSSLQSQLDCLRQEIEDYEALKSGEINVLEFDSLEELPIGLIKARIALNLSQKDLAGRLGLKEQQIQRYEAENYRSASFQRLVEIADALGIAVSETVSLPENNSCSIDFFEKLEEVGINRGFVANCIASPQASSILYSGKINDKEEAIVAQDVARNVERIFGWSPGELYGDKPLLLDNSAAASARFKMPAMRTQSATNAYAVYVRFLAGIVLNGCRKLPIIQPTDDPSTLRTQVQSTFGAVTLETVVRHCWSIGIPVLPLRDSGQFHGACWRLKGRNIIVLKQMSSFESRWLFDLLHEFKHASDQPDLEEHEVIEEEETSEARRNSDVEILASQFAGDAALDGRAEELVNMCVKNASGNLRFLKRAVQEIAAAENVPLGLLSNYLAYRLSLQGENWWGTAANLQSKEDKPWETVRDLFLEYFDFSEVEDRDQQILMAALTESMENQNA